jgi:hypothetical protein
VHKIRLFPLSLSSTVFNWFVSLPANLVDTWSKNSTIISIIAEPNLGYRTL